MSDTLTDFKVELRFNPVDAAALNRQVDPDGTADTQGITVVSDDSVEPGYVNVVNLGSEAEGMPTGLQQVYKFDPFTAAIIALSHNAAGEFEATKPYARVGDDGVNLLDTEDGKAGWQNLVGIERDELFAIAASHAQHEMIHRLIDGLTAEATADYGDDETALPDGTADFSA